MLSLLCTLGRADLTDDAYAVAELSPIPQIEMVKRLMKQALGDLDYGRHAASICAVVRGVPCYAVRVGVLAESAALVRRAVG